MSGILEDIKNRPSKDKVIAEVGTKAEVETRRKKEEVAQIKRLSQILNERKGAPVLKAVYIESLDCKLQFGDPNVGEFFDILKTARTSDNMDVFMFDMLHAMLKKADPELTEDALKKRIEAVEAIDILAEIMDNSPFFKKAFNLRTAGKFNLV